MQKQVEVNDGEGSIGAALRTYKIKHSLSADWLAGQRLYP